MTPVYKWLVKLNIKSLWTGTHYSSKDHSLRRWWLDYRQRKLDHVHVFFERRNVCQPQYFSLFFSIFWDSWVLYQAHHILLRFGCVCVCIQRASLSWNPYTNKPLSCTLVLIVQSKTGGGIEYCARVMQNYSFGTSLSTSSFFVRGEMANSASGWWNL